MKTISYDSAGVNVELGDHFVDKIKKLSHRTGHQRLMKGAGGYASVYPLTNECWIALTTDGVGTKVLLSHKFEEYHNIGIDLVAMCANDLICVGARPTLFLDYFATGKLDLEIGTKLIEGILDGCDQAGMLLVGGETAEMPDVYEASSYDMAGFAVGELSPENLITGERIKPSQKVIGLASSGIHSNGLSLARKLFKTDEELRALLAPTIIYVKPLLSVMQAFPNALTGVSHITGGGWRNIFRLNPDVGFVFTDPLPVLPLFERIITYGLTAEEGYKTFNMGMGMALVVNDSADKIVEMLNNDAVVAKVIGEVTDTKGQILLPEQNIVLTE